MEQLQLCEIVSLHLPINPRNLENLLLQCNALRSNPAVSIEEKQFLFFIFLLSLSIMAARFAAVMTAQMIWVGGGCVADCSGRFQGKRQVGGGRSGFGGGSRTAGAEADLQTRA